MNNIEITDEMVKRGCDWYYGTDSQALFHNRETMRKILEAALNPPPAPEIVVTEEMKQAGYTESFNHTVCDKFGYFSQSGLSAIYRAMRKLEPYDPLAKQGQMQSRRKNDGGGSGSGNCDR